VVVVLESQQGGGSGGGAKEALFRKRRTHLKRSTSWMVGSTIDTWLSVYKTHTDTHTYY